MEQQFLSKGDILCMQYAGMRAHQIMHSKFEKEEYAEAFETYIDKAENIMEMQHEYGIVTLTFQDEDFPCSLRKIGNACPPMIHCLGDLSLLAPLTNASLSSKHGRHLRQEIGKHTNWEENLQRRQYHRQRSRLGL